MTNLGFSRLISRDGLTVLNILWILEMTDFTEKKAINFTGKFPMAFSAIGSKDFLVPLQFHVSMPYNLVENCTNFDIV